MNTSKINVFPIFGGGYYADQKGGQALILRACPPGGSPKGGLRHRLTIGGDLYE